VSEGSVAAQNWLQTVGRSFGTAPEASTMALRQLSRMVRGQATVMAFADIFMVLTVMFLALLPLIALVRKPAPRKAPGGH
jgi:MFS transporter, DHA2 family, multidrug resistance protein